MEEALRKILSDETKLNEVTKAAFDTVNTDKSGSINLSQLEIAMNQIANDLGNSLPSKSDVESVFRRLDINNDGLIDFNEFKVLMRDVFMAMAKRIS